MAPFGTARRTGEIPAKQAFTNLRAIRYDASFARFPGVGPGSTPRPHHPMFESLQDGLNQALKTLRGKARLTEANMRDGLQLVEQSLLEADVSYSVVKDFMAAVGERAMGEKVLLSLNPTQQLIGIVHEELIRLLGPVDSSLHLNKDGVTVFMLCGLQGSGKTTTCGKLSRLLLDQNIRPMLVAADLQRPAAIEQLHVLGEQLGVPVYSEAGAKDPVKVCRDAVAKAKQEAAQVVILDTAGRLAIDQELMDELRKIDNRVQPDQVYLVVDGMTGQDAVNSAKAFNEALELNGVIMTKLDGDARGGALLSVKHVTGVPVKFIGTGEHLDSLEVFRPEGMASRILGQGDVLQLVDEARKVVSEKEQAELERKMREGEIGLDDFKKQLESFAQPGLMQRMLSLMPGMGELNKMMQGEDAEGGVKQMIGIINSMTPEERRNPKMIEPSRRNRIAKGAGVPATEVNQLVKQFESMKPVMQAMSGKGMGDRVKMMNQLKDSGMLNPGAQGPKIKQSTGKRLSNKQKQKLKKERERLMRKKKRESRRE
jgi:signal recognition particle subunit SRP54